MHNIHDKLKNKVYSVNLFDFSYDTEATVFLLTNIQT